MNEAAAVDGRVTPEARIYVAGHRGLVGSALVRNLRSRGYSNLVLPERGRLDLRNQRQVDEFFAEEQPEGVFLAAARVGGIHANNTYPADFIYDNLLIEANVIRAAQRNGVKRLMFLGSSCIYPKYADQPMREDALLTGVLEPTNEPYAIAKIAGIKLCESFNRQHGTDFRSVMPTNLYGPGDNFHPQNSHVIPGLMRRFHEAKQKNEPCVVVWGSGRPRREFLYVDDMAAASVFVFELDKASYDAQTSPMSSHINVGAGEDVAISELAALIRTVTAYEGRIEFDPSQPDGTPRKLMDVSRLKALGWQATVGLADGLARTYQWFSEQHSATDASRVDGA